MPQPGSQTVWSLSLGSNKQLPHRSGRMVVDTSSGVTRPGIDLIGTILGPSRWTVSFGKYALLLHGAPDRRWQSWQWRTLTIIGSAETMTLKAPHRHLAVLGIFVVSSDRWSDPVSYEVGLSWATAMGCVSE